MSAEKTDQFSFPTRQVGRRHFNHWAGRVILIITALAVIAGLLVLAHNNNHGSLGPVKSAHLLYVDSTKNEVTIADSSGKTLSRSSYPLNAYVNYEAAVPSGGTLLALSITTSSGGFIFTRDGKNQALSDEAVKTLRSAIVLDSSHKVFFTDDNTVILVVCGSTCKLVSLNLLTGKTADVVDSGVAPSSFLAPVYPLGVSADAKSVYLRVNGVNKLGKENGGLYQIDLSSHKVLRVIPMASEVGYTLSLSPDKKNLIYKSGGYGSPVTLHIIEVASGKKTTLKWDKGDITNQSSVFHWSPDSSKVLFQTANVILPTDGSASSAKPIATAYLDLPKKTVVELQTIDDPAHHNISYQNWLDSSQVVYELDTSSKPYDFVKPDAKVYKQDVNSKKISDLPAPGRLAQVVYW